MATDTEGDDRSQKRASDLPGKGEPFLKSKYVDDRRRQVSQAHRLGNDPFRSALPPGGMITRGTCSSV